MNTIAPPRRRSFVGLLLDGRHCWGYSEEGSGPWTARTGMQHRRLVVFPPGTDDRERRALVLRHRWPVLGGMLALLTAMLVSPVSSDLALWSMLLVYAGGFVVAFALTRRTRRACRSIASSRILVGDEVAVVGDEALLERCAATLSSLERRRDAGLLSEVGFELGWAEVYDLLEPA